MDYFSIWHWMIVIVVVMLLFGRNKVSDLMGDVAQGIRSRLSLPFQSLI